jgi:hypothetical protein
MRRIAALTALVALAGCQTTGGSGGLGAGTDTGHLSHRFIDVYLGKAVGTGFSHTIYFTEAFRNLTGSRIHLTSSRFCYALPRECFDMEYDIVIGPNETVNHNSNVSTDDPTGERYTETYFGTDSAGNPVALTVSFRAGDYNLPDGQRTAASPAR